MLRFAAKLRQSPVLTKKDLILTLLPMLLWWGAVHLRPHVIEAHCTPEAPACRPEMIWNVDRVSLGMESSPADGYSYATQNMSGILAAAIPALWSTGASVAGRLTPTGAALAFGTDLVLVLQTVFWNGAIGESVRIVTQRPRPFVYMRPAEMGANPAHYTSFYSGHTSFAAASTVALLLVLMGRGAPTWLLIVWVIGAQTLTFSTGIFRVMAGRHFVSDVIVGAAAGALVALVVSLLHKKRNSTPAP